ncbi:MAG: hypothetical protein K5876_03085 [Ruminiclostridium sp.]|nr:hypothetical protein [Ruminiclostridium sp.]
MKQNIAKKLAYIAACTMLAGTVGATAAYAVNEERDTGNTEEAPAESRTEDISEQPVKDETVYVLANADGRTDKIIVSDRLSNPDGLSEITESSTLRGVKNVKGDEAYTENGDTRTWNAAGEDIYYQGTTNAEPPVKLSVTYTLDGEQVPAAEMAGKSGRVTIRFDYENTLKTTKTINGEETDIYVPFAAITGMMLDNDIFRNVEVTNGRIVNDGDRTFVIGTAFPGMTESLGVKDSEKLSIPEYVEITADVKAFSLGNTLTIVTNELFGDLDLDLGSEEAAVAEDMDKLGDAMSQLIDGSARLHDGLAELLEKSSALTEGVGALYDGAARLNDGASAANEGVKLLSEGSIKLSDGLDTLDSNSAALSAGSEQVFASLLDIANTQLEAAGISGYTLTIDNYAQTLDAIIASLDENEVLKTAREQARAQVTEAVEAKRGLVESEVTKAVRAQVSEKVNAAVRETVEAKVTEAVRAKVLAGVLATQDMTPEKYEQALAAGMIPEQTQKAVEAAVEQQMQSDEIKAQITAAVDAQMQTSEVRAQADAALEAQMQSDEVKAIIEKTVNDKIAELIEENLASDEVQAKIKEGLGAAKAGVAKLTGLRAQLDSYNTFYTGLAAYTDGVSQAADGAKQLSGGLSELGSGTAALADGTQQLYDGIAEMNGSLPALIDGITQLRDGSGELAEGCERFNDEGIAKLIGLVDGDIGSILERMRAIKEASGEYSTFTGGSGASRFVYRTAGIE